DAINNFFNAANAHSPAYIARSRHPHWNQDGLPKIRSELQKNLERFANLARVPSEVGIKKSFANNFERDLHHVGMDVSRLAILPSAHCAPGVFHHRRAVGIDTSAVERWLREAALPQPEVAFARQQALAKKTHVCLHHAAFFKFARVRDEHLFDVIGMIYEKGEEIQQLQAANVAVVMCELGEKQKRITAPFTE